MIFNIKRKEFLTLANKTSLAASYSSPLKALGGIHMEADERQGALRLTATNLEVTIRAITPASIESGGAAVLDSRLLRSILGKLPGDDVYVELKNKCVVIKSGNTNYDIAEMPGAYPHVDIPIPDETVSVSGIKSLVRKTGFVSSKGDDRPLLNSVNLVLSSDGLRATATNGFCVAQTDGDRSCKGRISLTVPTASMRLLASISEDSDVFELGIAGESGKTLVFYDGMLLFSTRLYEEKFPDMDSYFDKFVPASAVKLNSSDLLQALKNFPASCSQIGMIFTENGLSLMCEDEEVSGSTLIKTGVTGSTGRSHYFKRGDLTACLHAVSGDIGLGVSEQGHLLLKSKNTRYFQLGVRPLKKKEKTEKPKKSPKQTKAA